MSDKNFVITLATLANGGELVENIIRDVMGNDIADTIEGAPLSRSLINHLAQVKFQQTLSKTLGAI